MSLHPDFVNELKKHFAGDIRLDLASRILYSADASIYQIEPLGVAIPKTQEDLISAVELAAKYNAPILPRGSGSSLAGQAIGEALILDCSRWLDKIIEINPESHTATVEPGVILAHLNKAAAKHGLQFGPDPASAERATMGGVIGNNATGAHSILYGMTADHLLSADAILSDGSLATFDDSIFDSRRSKLDSRFSNIVSAALGIREKYSEAIKENYPKSWRNSAGYRLNYLLPWSPSMPARWDANDYGLSSAVYRQSSAINLASLLAGSEGSLAVIRRATVNLTPRPKHTILGILAYDSIVEACEDVPNILKRNPSAVELIPQMILRLARAVPAYASQMGWVSGDPSALLAIEFSGDRPEILKEAVLRLREDVIVAESQEEQAQVWNVRKVGLGIMDSRPQSARPVAFIEDCAIPVERLAEFVREIEKILAEHKTEGGIYAHASAGTLHIRPVLNLKTAAGARSLRTIAEQTLALTLRLGGAMSSEHGDGIARGEWLRQTYGDEVIAAMRTLKRAADPNNLLNPDKMFDAPPMDSHLRYGEGYQSRAWRTPLHFDHESGLAGAVEQCNGQGVCRKSAGVMCPSFQATREEKNSTRGRANLLRAMIMSPNTEYQLSNHDTRYSIIEQSVYEALDLCLACKGCKAECPSGVDMAKIKFAFLDEYYKTHRRLLRDYLFGYFHVVAGSLSAVAPLANLLTNNAFLKTGAARILQIAPNRPFPKFTNRQAKPARVSVDREKIIFLSDAFSRYVEPKVEQAAFDVLTSLGFDVQVLPVVGAGAALLSKGFLNEARRHAGKVLDAIQKVDSDYSMPIVGVEPPEVYSLKRDYLDLLPERKQEIEKRIQKVWLAEEFLIRSDEFNLRVANKLQKKKNIKLLLQPHCHQQAEPPSTDKYPNGVNATSAILRACGYEVTLIEAGCCGMAGTFGYESEHYELSMQVGELKLFPAIRQSKIKTPQSRIVSTGAACRMQIEQGAGTDAAHPIVLIAEALDIVRRGD